MFRNDWEDLLVELDGSDLTDGQLWLSVIDLKKCYLFLGLGPCASDMCAFSDPRYEPQWPLSSPPPMSWRLLGGDERQGRWRQFLCVPFGLAPAVAYCSALSGEMSSMLLAHAIPNNYFVDDDLIVKRGYRKSLEAKEHAGHHNRLGVSPRTGKVLRLHRRSVRWAKNDT